MPITIKNLHKDLPEDQLHEAKGFTTASNNTYLKKNHDGESEWLAEYWIQPVRGVVTGTSAPLTETTGHRYIITAASGYHADWDSPAQYDVVEFNGTSWISISAVDGMRVYSRGDDADYYFDTTGWGVAAHANTTYTISAVDSGSDAIIRLTAGGSGSGDDDVTLVAGTNITITPSGDDITIASTGGAGTVTSVGTAGTVNGVTLTGTVTASGNLTLGGTLAVNNGDWSGTDLSVANGGTGASTLTANGVLIGNGTSAIASVDMSTKGHILIGDGSGNPSMLAIGDDDQVLTADSGEATGVKWADAGGGGGASALGDLSDCITSATENYGIGTNAMDSITTGDNNIGIGLNAGTGLTASSDSVAIGTNAMTYAHTGLGRSVAIGYYALRVSTNRMMVGIGYNAGALTSTGEKNVYVGYDAGGAVTTGSTNVAIGSSSNCAATSNNQIAIGASTSTDGVNKIRLGNSSMATANIQIDWTIDSDERIKENITDGAIGLDFINDLRPVTFTKKHPSEWDSAILEDRYKIGGSDYDDETDEVVKDEFDSTSVIDGLIAQEVKATIDSLGVNFSGWGEDSKGKQGVQYAALVVPLIKAVQELSAKVDALENA
tara:strand:- start:2166 stop:3986 length:1821 start_codon:yes stop_codon:yes gene_type:complete